MAVGYVAGGAGGDDRDVRVVTVGAVVVGGAIVPSVLTRGTLGDRTMSAVVIVIAAMMLTAPLMMASRRLMTWSPWGGATRVPPPHDCAGHACAA